MKTPLRKHQTVADNPLIGIYIKKSENRITFEQTPEIMKLLGSNKNKINNDENCENVPNLETTELVSIHCNIVNNDYQQVSRVLYTFVCNKPFDQLLDISQKSFIFLKAFDLAFLYIKV